VAVVQDQVIMLVLEKMVLPVDLVVAVEVVILVEDLQVQETLPL
jgi:hypothetical protein